MHLCEFQRAQEEGFKQGVKKGSEQDCVNWALRVNQGVLGSLWE